MSISQKVLGGMSIAAFGAILVLAAGLYMSYSKVIALEKINETMRQDITRMSAELEAEIKRSEDIAQVTVELGERNEKIQGQFLRFSRGLSTLKRDNADIRNTLSIVVPRVVLSGLQSFEQQNDNINTGPPDATANNK